MPVSRTKPVAPKPMAAGFSLAEMTAAFRRNRAGSIAPIFAFVIIPTLAFLGIAIDFGRAIGDRAALQGQADATVLAAGREYQTSGNLAAAQAAGERFFYRAVPSGVIAMLDTITLDSATGTFRAHVTSGTPTTFLSVIGKHMIHLGIDSEATIRIGGRGNGGGNLEVSLVLDVTGSMCADGTGPCTASTKMDALKLASKDLVTIISGANDGGTSARIALVPFSTRVRVGPDGGGDTAMKAMTNLDPIWDGYYKTCVDGSGDGGSETGGNWVCNRYQTQQVANWMIMPCVTDRFMNSGDTYDLTDDAPGAGKWMNAHGGDRMPVSWDSSDAVPTTNRGLVNADPATNWNYDTWGGCADVANSDEMLPLTADAASLNARIDGLEAYGATGGALGTAFAWYTLSPNWNDVFPAASAAGTYEALTRVNAHGKPELRKVAVIMSDGVYNTVRGWKDQPQAVVSQHAKDLCSNMKAAGLEIYTVGFALDELSNDERTVAEDTLRSCGSDVEHFYNTLSTDQLRTAFRDIAMKMSTLYLSR